MLPITPGTVCLLEGNIGVERDHVLAPSRVDLDNDDTCFAPYFRKAMDQLVPIVAPFTQEAQDIANGMGNLHIVLPTSKSINIE